MAERGGYEYTVARVREALAEDERTHLMDVDVRIAGGKLFLVGQVESPERREAAERVAREQVAEDVAIVNDLWIAKYEEGPGTENVP